MLPNWTFKKAVSYIPFIIAIGIAIGVASNALWGASGLLQSILLHSLTSFCVGFPLVVFAFNAHQIAPEQSESYRIVLFGLLFALIGVVASEIETACRSIFFSDEPYRVFSGGGLYLFNAILSVILGFSIKHSLDGRVAVSAEPESPGINPVSMGPGGEGIAKIPIKKGPAIHLLPIDAVSMFEAADKYAYVYEESGAKHLCDYSLATLEKKLPNTFARVHRKYIVNVAQIIRIQPFDKKRYVIDFVSDKVPTVKSSAGYQDVVRDLIKI